MLVLVVVLVLDLWDPSAIILFHHSDREICSFLEDEHDFYFDKASP
ncbi:MAG: hypothetical protein JO070_02490 [Verrucomicrobia bacterium]|nr:hypothetical protein [Verrucomicrobiota bacterium]